MAKDRDRDNDYGEDSAVRRGLGKRLDPQADEGCNAFYTRRQRTTDSVLAPDTEAKLVDSDDSFAESRNYPNQDQGPMNTPWVKDFYGRGR